MRHAFTQLICTTLVFFSVYSALRAQEIPEEKLATTVFELNLSRLLENQHIQAMGFLNAASIFGLDSVMPPGAELKDVTRFNGAYQLNVPFEEVWEQFSPDAEVVPLEFYFQIHFTTEKVVNTIKSELADNFSVEKIINGRTYFQLFDGDSSMLLHFGDRFLELGTQSYVTTDDKNLVLAENLKSKWLAMPEQVVARGAIDVEASRSFLDGLGRISAEEWGSEDPTMGMVAKSLLEVLDDVNYASGHFDLTNDELLSLHIETPNPEATETVKGVADGLLFLTALPLKNLINMIPVESEEGKAMLVNLAEQAKATELDDGVGIKLVKPEGFDDVVAKVYVPYLKHEIQLAKCTSDLQTIGQSVLYFERENGFLPFNVEREEDWNADLSWRVRITTVPFPTFDSSLEVDVSQSYEHENNLAFADEMPSLFGISKSHSRIVWVKSKVKTRDEITDGFPGTIMLIVVPKEMEQPWMQPGDDISIIKVIQMVSKLDKGEEILAANYHGNMIRLDNSMTHNELKVLLTPDAGD